MTTDANNKNRWQQLKTTFVNFNIFENVESLNNEWEVTTERISTRLFFFFLSVTITILFTYIVLSPDIKRETIYWPLQSTYEHLLTLHPDSLQCSCFQTSITYSSFISIDPTFHPVCQSEFVSQDWIEFLFDYNESYYSILDFRSTGSSQFQLLAALCQLANASFDLAQANIIDASTLISVQLISPTSLLAQANALIQQFRLVSPNSYVRILNLIRGLTAGNKLVPTMLTLFAYRILQIYEDSEEEIVRDGGSYITTNGELCYCNTQATCSSPSGIYENATPSSTWDLYFTIFHRITIPGFFMGCYALESLLQSTLECFFNQICVNFVQANVKKSHTFNFTAINGKSMILFTPTWSIEKIIAQLMIDDWQSSISYEKYYDQCHPVSCTYLHVKRHDFLYIVTTLIGLTGGLVSALQLLVPFIVRIIRKWLNRQKKDQSLNAEGKYFKFSCSTYYFQDHYILNMF